MFTWRDHGVVGERWRSTALDAHRGDRSPAGAPTGEYWVNAVWLDDERVVVGRPSGRLLVWDPSRDAIIERWNDPPANDVTDATLLRMSLDRETLLVVGDRADDDRL